MIIPFLVTNFVFLMICVAPGFLPILKLYNLGSNKKETKKNKQTKNEHLMNILGYIYEKTLKVFPLSSTGAALVYILLSTIKLKGRQKKKISVSPRNTFYKYLYSPIFLYNTVCYNCF